MLLLLRFTFVVRALGFLLINFIRTEREREKRNSSALLRESTAEAQRCSHAVLFETRRKAQKESARDTN